MRTGGLNQENVTSLFLTRPYVTLHSSWYINRNTKERVEQKIGYRPNGLGMGSEK